MTFAAQPGRILVRMAGEVVRAAGGLITRTAGSGDLEILIVHRPRYDDWSLPKGKAEPGESDEACALREVEEETGLVCELGEEVAVTSYSDGSGRPKRVRYYAMTRDEGAEPLPQNEVDAVRWVTPKDARRKLSYARDRAVVEHIALRVR
jgi:8-oxo-dGTP pyrophosphatase MutT (NUDIX family)